MPKRYSNRKSVFVLIVFLLISYIFSDTPLENKIQAPQLASPTPKIANKDNKKVPTTILPSTDVLETATHSAIRVIRIVDGDTIVLEGNTTLRYIGINTPETVDPRQKVQCFGKEASQRNKELVAGEFVTLEKDVSETDRFGRLLRYVYVDGIMINKQLVEEGFALASAYPPDIKHQAELDQAQKAAQTNKRGLWSSCPNF